MTRRDWALAGATFLFIGAGYQAWAAGGGIARTALGAAPMLVGVAALRELIYRSLR